MANEAVLTKNFGTKNSHTLGVYEQGGGYKALKKALTGMKPEAVMAEVDKSGLRGRGGAGFPTGKKWSFIPKDSPKPKYLTVNADEGEPGTYKDRPLMELDPHAVIEGSIITCYAVGIHSAFIYVRGEYVKSVQRLNDAINEAYAGGYLGKNILNTGFDLDIVVHRGAGAYICGEETGLLESLEGKKGQPRMKPPFPAIVGAFQGPTVINNVETMAAIPPIVNNGGEWFNNLGAPGVGGGLKLYPISGHVKKPGVYELPMGTTLRDIIYKHAGGIRDDKKLKAVIPGGSSAPVLRADEIDVKMDYNSLAAIKTMLGSGAIIVMDEDTNMVKTLKVLLKFYAHESCGKCTPCREGTGWMDRIMTRIVKGNGHISDLDTILSISNTIDGKTLCPMGQAAIGPSISFITKFRNEFEDYIRKGRTN
ncbi:MAG: NADH oxidoreductase (quinone) subunit F [Planctomycetes bacterium RIFCSPHIGHO2_02_FULL_50_42]|nr:MAG: NADH oxidoreductase (quinone) subunit F [Planctomycetes bacterium RIFCSPHIGHO2_02_FULL_50_42]OHB91666.1 MAG: NADH oxidoreductase (quinone) subunit F [Planctomycetes bacterium RIFCSPHIGHO2_12_FULL_51_37]OHB96265.1 MAG: NADH oxidoreductase (quinone) subunit F [Planctomycetes bacterium RIFCSPLOWO2_02_FULL_50_16]OHC04267.1 MAG: NADH oxidoreductase (quinone) subunit F [Planctomycetes bacterium RIFCSPLOWO2_12_FULL_50_35]